MWWKTFLNWTGISPRKRKRGQRRRKRRRKEERKKRIVGKTGTPCLRVSLSVSRKTLQGRSTTTPAEEIHKATQKGAQTGSFSPTDKFIPILRHFLKRTFAQVGRQTTGKGRHVPKSNSRSQGKSDMKNRDIKCCSSGTAQASIFSFSLSVWVVTKLLI